MKGARASIVIAIENMPFDRDTRARLIARTLAAAGYDVSVVCPRLDGERSLDEVDGIDVRSFRTPPFDRLGLVGHLLEYAWCCAALACLLLWRRLAGRADVVHFCLPPHPIFPVARLLRRLGCAVVADQHDLMPELFALRYGPRHRLLAAAVERAERAALHAADQVIVPNRSSARAAALRASVDVTRISIVRTSPCGVDLPAPAPRRGPPLVGYVGNVERQDGLDLLVAAVPHVRSVFRRDVRFVCIGDGCDLPRIRRLARELHVSSDVEFTGRLPREEALARLAECDICVQPDPSNPFTDSCTMVKSLEYMALGKPVVAFDLPETRAACGDAALYATGNDPADLAAKIVSLLTDGELRLRLGAAGIRRIEGPLAWPANERALLDAYARLPARTRRLRRIRQPAFPPPSPEG